MWRRPLFFIFLALCLLPQGEAFEVIPQRIFLSKKRMTDSLKVRNAWTRDITVQIKLFRWRQDDRGKCIYEETKEIVFYPQIFKLSPKEKRIVRIGAKVKNVDIEQTYRLYLEEIPLKEDAGGELKVEGEDKETRMGLRMLIRYGVPIFVLPEKERVSLEVEDVSLKEKNLSIRIKNSSNVHLVIRKLKIKGYDKKEGIIFEDEKPGWYLLSGARKGYEFLLKEDIKDKLFYIDTAISTDKMDFKKRVYEGEIKVDY